MLSEISQRKTNIMWSHFYMESKKQSKKTIKIKTTYRYREQTNACQMAVELGVGMGEKGEGIKKYKLAVTK